MLTLTLPLPPSVNHCYTTRIQGGRVLTRAGRLYMERAGWLAIEGALQAGWSYEGQRLKVALTLHYPNHQRRDIDNSLKVVLDAVSRALNFDDSAIDLLLVGRGEISRQHPRCEVRIGTLRDGAMHLDLEELEALA